METFIEVFNTHRFWILPMLCISTVLALIYVIIDIFWSGDDELSADYADYADYGDTGLRNYEGN